MYKFHVKVDYIDMIGINRIYWRTITALTKRAAVLEAKEGLSRRRIPFKSKKIVSEEVAMVLRGDEDVVLDEIREYKIPRTASRDVRMLEQILFRIARWQDLIE